MPPPIGHGVSEFSARFLPDGPIGGPGDSWGTEHLGYRAWILELTGLIRKPGDEWGVQPHSPSGFIASGRQHAQLLPQPWIITYQLGVPCPSEFAT